MKLAKKIKHDTKSFYAYVRSRSSTRVKAGPLVNSDGTTMTSDEQMAEELNRYFASVFTDEDITALPDAEPVFMGSEDEILRNIEITEEMVAKYLFRLREDKASGADELSPRFLLSIANEIVGPLTMIFRKSLTSGIVPDDWRTANVAPVFKKGKRSLCENYRPISLTSQICKLFETIVRDAVVKHLESHSLITESQHGFRRGHSCLSNLLDFLDKLTKSLNDGRTSDIIYLDFAKAFDKVPHKRLISKIRCHGIDGQVLSWIEAWLRDRRQRVCLRGSSSSWCRVCSGVPQGSVLGPVLFLIFINDLDTGVSSDVLKFADDTKLFREVTSRQDSICIQEDLNRLVEWARIWQMQFNEGKCKVMHLGGRNEKFSYTMNNHVLEETTLERDLGIQVSSDLKVSIHCQHSYNRANRILGLIKRTFVCRDQKTMINLYRTMVRPHLEYSVSAWSPHYKKDRILLERIQHRFTRFIPGCASLPYEERLRKLGLWSLEERRNRADLIEVYKILNGLSSPSLKSLFVLDSYGKTRGTQYEIVQTSIYSGCQKILLQRKCRWQMECLVRGCCLGFLTKWI